MPKRTTPALAVFTGLLAATATASHAEPTPGVGESVDWTQAERGLLSDYVQLTSREDYVKAGEAYFDPTGARIIFQAVPVPPEGEKPSDHYSMYVADLVRDDAGAIIGLGSAIRLDPAGSANTCGWFHPTEPNTVLFGSTLISPSEENVPGYQRGTGRYRWAFPSEMDIVTMPITGGQTPTVLFERPGYDAEGSYSPDGRHVLYANVDMLKSAGVGRADADLYVFDTKTGEHRALIEADGYDGGPFFGPPDEQGRPHWITYRSDRVGDNLLQLFIAELEYADPSDPAKITGVRREIQLTENGHVNWCPWWDNDGRFLVYATSEVGHFNYEVFAVPALNAGGEPVNPDNRDPVTVRITNALGFDGLPVFSPSGEHMMWTSQRGPAAEGENRPSSQLWIARVDRDEIAERLGMGD